MGLNEKTRREFLRHGGTALALGAWMPRWVQEASAQAAKESSGSIVPAERILVLVEIAGGNDGLNTFVPFADDLYHKARPNLALKEKEILRLSDSHGLHPSLKNMREIWDQGQLAILQSVGYPKMNRSHFEASEIYQSAQLDRAVLRGWVGRHADRVASPAARDAAAATLCRIGQSTPIAFLAENAGALALDNAEAFELRANERAREDRPAIVQALSTIYAESRSGLAAARLAQAYREAQATNERLKKAAQSYETSGYPNQALGNALKLVAQMIHGGFGVRAYYVSLGGFDTHANQKGQHANLLTQLSEALAAFHKDLAAHGHGERVLTLTFSEFGRRVQENGSQGTDHGTTIPMFALGGKVKGGIYGKNADLADLADGDPKHDLDFRQVYASVIENWWGSNSQAVLGGEFSPISFLA